MTQASDRERGLAALGATTLAELKDCKFGAQIGTTSLQFINTGAAHDEPAVYPTRHRAEAT